MKPRGTKKSAATVKIAPADDEDCVLGALRDGGGSRFFTGNGSNLGKGELQGG